MFGKLCVVIIGVLVVFSLAACMASTDEEFKNVFTSAVNTRLKEKEAIGVVDSRDKSFKYKRILSDENKAIESYKDKKFKNEALKKIYLEYLDLLSEEIRLTEKECVDYLNSDDEVLYDSLYNRRIDIYKELYSKHSFKFDEALYKSLLAKHDKYLKRKKNLSTPLTEDEKSKYSQNIDYDSIMLNESSHKDEKYVIKGIVGGVGVYGVYGYFNLFDDNNNAYIMTYDPSILSKTLKEGQYIRCWFDYKGNANTVTVDNTSVIRPSGDVRAVVFQ